MVKAGIGCVGCHFQKLLQYEFNKKLYKKKSSFYFFLVVYAPVFNILLSAIRIFDLISAKSFVNCHKRLLQMNKDITLFINLLSNPTL